MRKMDKKFETEGLGSYWKITFVTLLQKFIRTNWCSPFIYLNKLCSCILSCLCTPALYNQISFVKHRPWVTSLVASVSSLFLFFYQALKFIQQPSFFWPYSFLLVLAYGIMKDVQILIVGFGMHAFTYQEMCT